MKVGDRLRKIPLTLRGCEAKAKKGKIENYRIKQIMSHMILAEHESGYLEAFSKADVIAPADFKLDVKENDEWRYVNRSDFR